MACIPFFTCEPMIKTVQHGGSDICHYDINRITRMRENTALASLTEYSGECYAPDAFGDVDFGNQLRSMIDYQVTNIRTLQYRNSQSMELTQAAFTFNTYFHVDDGGTDDTIWSVIYDTRGMTALEAGARNYNYTPGIGYAANTCPDQDIMHGQYFSIMWRNPSNAGENERWTLGETYCYIAGGSAESKATSKQIADVKATNRSSKTSGPDPTPGYGVISDRIIDSRITRQSFRYSGTADWQEWGEGHGNVLWARFWIRDDKGTRTYLTPYLYPKWCDEPGVMYLYYVNSMGGIDFIRSNYASMQTLNTERSTYETNNSIDDRFKFGTETYHQTRWNTYTFKTEIVSDFDSYNMADIVNARWAWLYIPDETVQWRSVKITDVTAKVKQKRNEEQNIYNYTFQLEDSIKAKIV